MVMTILGAILLLIPLAGLFYFRNKALGLIYIFVGLGFFHLSLSLILQALHLFTYPAVLAANLLLAIGTSIFLFIKRREISFKIKFDWRLIVAAAVIFFELFSVHYLYTGLMASFTGHKNVVNNSYPYPYFSDEWAGVAFTKYSINENSLPIMHPLLGNGQYLFPNIFIAFFSGLSEIFLVLNLDPLIGFPIIALLSGLLVCLFVYLFLKSAGVDSFFASIGALSIPLITNSGNLPSIWFLFPFIGGTIFFLISLIALNFKEQRLAVLSSFLCLLIYPPLVVLVVPAFIAWFFLSGNSPFRKYSKIFLVPVLPIILAALFIFIFQKGNWHDLIFFFKASLIRVNNEGCIPARGIWNIIPVILLPFSIIGLFHFYKQKLFYFLIPTAVALTYWLVYAYCPYFLIIDYARIAAIASYLLVIASAAGMEKFFAWISERYDWLKEKESRLALEILIFLLFFIASISYTQRTNWTKIVLRYDTALGVWERPTNPPANMYLHQDDLRLFKDINKKRFISPDWKGLVIGAATGNFPLEAKPSIITNFVMPYDEFMRMDCSTKEFAAKKVDLDYAYSFPFDCPSFKYLGKSREGLYLYKFQP